MDAVLLWAVPLAVLLVLGAMLWARQTGRRRKPAPPPARAVADRLPAAPAPAPVDAAANAVAAQREAAVEALCQARRRAAADAARIEAARQAPPPVPPPPSPRTVFQPLPPRDAAGPPPQRLAPPAGASALPVAPSVARAPAAAPPASPALPRRPPDAPPAPPTVLVVDDSKVVRIKISRLLEQQRYRVLLAEDGLSALQTIEDQRPDLVITDVEMPGLDGFALTQRLRAQPRWARLPVIMITSSDDKHRADAAAVGVDVLLGKPYPEEVLLAEVHKALAAARPSTAQAATGLTLQ